MTDVSPSGSRPAEDQTIDRRVAGYLRRQGMDPLATRVERLHGDASNRCYVRIIPRTGPSVVLAVHPAPFVTGGLPEIAVGALFERAAVPVPVVMGQAGDLGILVLEDLGDQTLQDWLTVPGRDPAPPVSRGGRPDRQTAAGWGRTAHGQGAALLPGARREQADLGAGVSSGRSS